MKLSSFLCWSLCAVVWTACNSNPSTNQEAEDVDVKTVGGEADPDTRDWEVLFDGSGLDQWRNFRKNDIHWKMEDGTLTTSGGNGDIVTKDTYGNFEMEFDWKISEGGNSGVMYLVKEGDHEETYHTGPEYQIIDEEGFGKKSNTQLEDNQTTGANYALDAPTKKAAKPVGEWNHGKIIVKDGHVEHWLNGEKVLDYTLWTDQWKEKVSKTKFSEWPDYGMAKEGHIALQDHGDRVWFKNIRIKRL